jgi:hypothetical protein
MRKFASLIANTENVNKAAAQYNINGGKPIHSMEEFGGIRNKS